MLAMEPPAADAAHAAPPSNEAILLFCRLPGEPYVHCGRLALQSLDERHAPLRFVWRLLDAPAMADSAPFQRVIAGARVVRA